jgi:hypothetical protein
MAVRVCRGSQLASWQCGLVENRRNEEGELDDSVYVGRAAAGDKTLKDAKSLRALPLAKSQMMKTALLMAYW